MHFWRARCESCHVQVVGPGDSVLVLPEAGQLRVGAGLHAEGSHLRTTRPGVLRRTKAGKLWVQGRQKRCVLHRRARLASSATPSGGRLWLHG